MKQGEGVLYATDMGIVIYNFRRDDQSVYSEPGFALHTPKANAGMSIISKASFQDMCFGYMAPPFVGSNGFWFPHTWFPEFVPMLLNQAPAHFRHIAMFSHNNSNLARRDAHLENIRIYDANIVEAEHRSLRELQYEHDDHAGKCFDPELSSVVIPPDDVLSDASDADIPPNDVTTPIVPVPTPTQSVIHICQIMGQPTRPTLVDSNKFRASFREVKITKRS